MTTTPDAPGTTPDDISDIQAEVQRRLDAGRADGTYPEALDDQLASGFARVAKDPLWFASFDELGRTVDRLRSLELALPPVNSSSSTPGVNQLHKVISRVVDSRLAAVSAQLRELAEATGATAGSTRSAFDEVRAVLNNDVFGDIDDLHYRLVEIEQRLNRIEAGARPTSH